MAALRAFVYTGPESYLEPVLIDDIERAVLQPAVYVISEDDTHLLRQFPEHFCFVEDRDPDTDAALWDYFYNVAQSASLTVEKHPVVAKHYRRRQSLRSSLRSFWKRLLALANQPQERLARLKQLAATGQLGTHFLSVEELFFAEDLDGRRKFVQRPLARPIEPGSEVPNWAHEVMDESLWGNSAPMHDVREFIWRAARHQSTSGMLSHVLVQGSPGTGKEVVAELIHHLSYDEGTLPPPDSASVLDCRALSGEELRVRLFGWVGPDGTQHPGVLEACRTVILDRVVDLDYGVQRELEQALLDADAVRGVSVRFSPLASGGTNGGHQRGPLRDGKARIVALSGADLHANADRFRAQLHFLLSRCVITTPSLQDHPQDIPELANRFWLRSSPQHRPLPADSLAQLAQIAFRGNGREVEYLMLNATQHFPDAVELGLAQLREVLEISGYLPDASTNHQAQQRRRQRQLRDILTRAMMELDYFEHVGGDPFASKTSLESKLRELDAFGTSAKMDTHVAEALQSARAAISDMVAALASGAALGDASDRTKRRLEDCFRAVDSVA